MTSFRILSDASEELEAAVAYYNSQQQELGTAFLEEFENTVERIVDLPLAARVVRGDVRRKLIHRFPFFVLYRPGPDEVTIVAVAHRRRRPGYWVGRR